MRCRLIFNPESECGEGISAVARRLRSADRVELCPATQPDEVREAARSAPGEGFDRLVVAGGDGTLRDAIQGLAPDFPEIDLAILPLGTGNDLARALGFVDGVEQAVEAATGGEAVPVDVIRLESDEGEGFFANVANGGLGGRVANHVGRDQKKRWGAFAYWKEAVTSMADPTVYAVELRFEEGRREDLEITGLAVANGRFVGGGFPIARAARLDDGVLDVTALLALEPLQLMSAGIDFALGRDTAHDWIRSYSGTRVELRADSAITFSIDGDPFEAEEALFELRPGVLRIVPGPEPPALGSRGEEMTRWPEAFAIDVQEQDLWRSDRGALGALRPAPSGSA